MRRDATAKLLEAAPVFAALGDETRLTLVTRLSETGPQPIVRLTDGMGITRQAVTKHLAALEDAGLIRSARVGRERIWELEPKGLDRVQRQLATISRQWDAAIERLRAFVEE
jgi:DNA-binding transcriptional ArsR family regulator